MQAVPDYSIYALHRCTLGIYWKGRRRFCQIPKEIVAHKKENAKADRTVNGLLAKNLFLRSFLLAQVRCQFIFTGRWCGGGDCRDGDEGEEKKKSRKYQYHYHILRKPIPLQVRELADRILWGATLLQTLINHGRAVILVCFSQVSHGPRPRAVTLLKRHLK